MNSKPILICLLFSFYSYAQTCCSGGIPLSNNIGLPTLSKGSFQIGVHYDYNNLNTLNFEKEKLDDNSRLRITHSALLNINYSIFNNLSIEGLFTYVNQRRKIMQFGNENLDQTSGIGDAVLLTMYKFKPKKIQNLEFNIGVGAKIPLGSTTEKSTEGIVLNADLQPGSNTWDVIYLMSVGHSFNFRPSFQIGGRIIYRATGINNSYYGNTSYKFGDEFLSFLSFSDIFVAFKTLVSPSLSLKYRNVVKDELDEFPLDNTGGNFVSLIPNFTIDITPNITFSTKAELPIYSYVEGTQLTPTYRVTTGVLLRLEPKPRLFN
ncbi:transporter [Pontimicrobium sp. SW4]|uniref:Transporter n=1 Tax=Pontimicrobium sp. SW4 TaxID=3153519 RepID=A0AAU7BR16_9FLAO